MNDDQAIFAEMLGIRKRQEAVPVQVVRSVSEHVVDPVSMVSELDVQREVVESMALEKAELEEERSALEREKIALENEKRSLEEEKRGLEEEKKSLEERIGSLEADFALLKSELESARAGNDELEEKLSRMGRSLAAAKRAAAESGVRSESPVGGLR